MRLFVLTVAIALAGLCAAAPAAAQFGRFGPPPGASPAGEGSPDDHGFRFVRVKYRSVRSSRWGGATWAYDYPTAEKNLYEALERASNVHLAGPPLVLTLDDERIFDHPILYLTEPGYWAAGEKDIENLKKYFARGGFMIIDDFHDRPGGAPRQWDNFYHNIKRVFPDREVVELSSSHPIWSIYYDIDPGAAASTKPDFGRQDDAYYAIFDDQGRMMTVICYNQDIGDGWEWPGRNLADASTVSFQMAINFIMYALTH